jgi:hypothetical protein
MKCHPIDCAGISGHRVTPVRGALETQASPISPTEIDTHSVDLIGLTPSAAAPREMISDHATRQLGNYFNPRWHRA